jgi:hypothetical protein
MSYLINRVARKIQEYGLQKLYEIAVEKMIERGYEATNVKKIGGKIIFEVDKTELTGYEVEDIKADTLEEYMEGRIDGEIDQPRYKYDEDFDEDPESPADHHRMIEPGKYVDIDALRDWVRTTKINRDEDLQDALRYDVLKISVNLEGLWTSTLDRAVDHIAFKVARKIYYVGRKPPTMTPEEWDIYIADKRPEPGTYSKNEDWGERGFPYGADYKTREGAIDIPEDSLASQAFYKGWTHGGFS